MPEPTNYQAMPLSQLVTGCRQETAKFQEQQLSDENYCFEILRRTFQQRNPESEEVFALIYTAPLRIWLRQYQARWTRYKLDEDVLLNGVFMRLFRYITPEGFSKFSSLPKILYYFKTCCMSEVLDELRRCGPQQNELPLSFEAEPGQAAEQYLSEPGQVEEIANWLADRSRFWRQIDRHLLKEMDRVAVYARFKLQMPPREIARAYPGYFPDEKAVSRCLKNALIRLRNDPDLQEWF